MEEPAYRVFISKTAQKEIKHLDPNTKKKVDRAILAFYENPFMSNTEKLIDHPEAEYRHRIGNWRILFDLLTENTIHIVHIWPRGKNYKK